MDSPPSQPASELPPHLDPAFAPEEWGPALRDAFHRQMRLRHLARRTEKAYMLWVRRYLWANPGKHPIELGAEDVTAFLSDLATTRRVSASTQN